ncbi:hypothetical protein BJ138DRAFT_1069699 [Hygrophoropsis aurantiaca]|uniref:Uncharacterized protein n=1 Tax=Hygrophoropsis aurantiaca TaxID=72124 RepID=A0ACB8A4A5_9AGAM|nr:hypothetical protein BJ138DRAFT_1069699 [Hygrophoropsis aurantiaca]
MSSLAYPPTIANGKHNKPRMIPDPPFPAGLSFGTASRELIPGQAVPLTDENVSKFLREEISVFRLNDIHEHLWMAGRKGNLHPIHWQKMNKREITITEDPNMHLVWYDSTIFIKPLPVCLLDHEFFCTYISPNRTLFEEACGFLRTYTILVRHESDFHIAMDVGLLPRSITWEQWSMLAYHLSSIQLSDANRRYVYGELRLHRLNLVHNIYRRKPWYQNIYRDYYAWLSSQLRWLLIVFAYMSVLLGAMQVVMSSPLAGNVVSAVCYWFGIATILVLVTVLGSQLTTFLCTFVINFIGALQ